MEESLIHIEPVQPDHHLEPQWWSVVSTNGIRIDRVPDVTAVTVVDGWLVLWRYALIVGLFRPGVWGGASICLSPAYMRFTY